MSAASKRPVSPERVAVFIGASAIAFAVLSATPPIKAALHRSVCAAGGFIDATPPAPETLMGLPVTFLIIAMLLTAAIWPLDDRAAVPLTPVAARSIRLGCTITLSTVACTMALSFWLFAPSSICVSSGGLR